MSGEKVARAVGLRKALGPFFERARVPVIVVERGGHLASANDAALTQYGYALAEMVELSIDDLLAGPRGELPDDLEHAYRGDHRALARRPHRRKDGTVLWVVPVAGPQSIEGETFIVSALQDVTAVVSAEERAAFERARGEVLWEGAVERLGSAVALFDADRRIVRMNRNFVQWMKQPEAELAGKRCDELFLLLCATQPCLHAVAAAEQRRVVVEIESARGWPFRVEVFPAPPNNTGVATVHLGHDLSEERAMRSRLVAADRLASLGRVAAGVAHEVNNPAAFVTLALPLAKERIGQGRPAEAVAFIEEAITATAQIAEVMRDLGGVVRDRPRAVVDLSALVESTLRIASYEAETRARVERVLEPGALAEVRPTRIAQVLLNLVLNAAQAIPEGDAEHQRIEVRTRRAGDRVLIEVADTGPGVPEAIAARIFEPFFTTRGGLGGTGLGLWLSRTIVEEEGGTLTSRNRPEGGAVFTVSLPLSRGAEAETRASAE
jgi:PAS domain S-box-containing protein